MIDYEKFKSELKELISRVSLEKDPIAAGIDYFNNKYQEIQEIRDRMLSILTESIENKSKLNNELTMIKEEYESELSSILVREDVKPLKSNELRMAVANNELKDKIKLIGKKERECAEADAFFKICNLYYEECKDKNDNLSRQLLATRLMYNIDPALKDNILKLKEEKDEN